MLPTLFQLGPFTLHSFGLMVMLGFVAGTWLAARLARERGLPEETFLDGAVLFLFSSIAGARLLYVALNWNEFSRHLGDVAALWQGGMSFHGGAFGGVLAGVLYARARRLPVLALADAAAPALALGYAVGRLGCLLNGCCYGGPTHLPWGMHFPGTDPSRLYHPAQIYASVISVGLMALLVAAYRRPHRAGQILALYIGLYSAYRFAIEFLRKDVTADVLALGLTEAQVFSLFAIAAAALWWRWLASHSAAAPERGAELAAPAPTAA